MLEELGCVFECGCVSMDKGAVTLIVALRNFTDFAHVHLYTIENGRLTFFLHMIFN